ncbi:MULTISPECIES: uroporphyrinogen-III synthase [Actinoallomurus]|uniref:uroporphyrinogen-III synthase n=1 Tax=Actinoallomurus TaxID=667113 RepID=UPI002091F288|nr:MULTISPECIES: uroporphyrinogen-III synthase [Actinoallomurus]MCO5971200.1 uroporphyrinogen-III synthase [Actinoallomurus soli]MCO5995160.1 uroporphyrinogen-III synthase [Actinoallomurus rhizosphaericola]
MKDTPLAGFTVGVTAARRHEELTALLERKGARVVYAPAIRLVPLADDAELLAATREILADPVDDVIVTTGIGFRAWLETADGWGLRDDLIKRLGDVRILARGPKAKGAVRAAGMAEAWSPESENCDEVLRHLLEEDLRGRRIAVQLYGDPTPHLTGTLRRAGADVVEVPVYRWARTDDPTPLRRLVGQAVAGTIDAITFTSAPAVSATLAVAADDNLEDPLLEALRTQVVAACVGSVTAAPLEERDVATVRPERARLGALVRTLAAELPVRRSSRVAVAGHALELRGHAVVIDGQLKPIAPAPMAILRALARRPGHVVSRAELCTVLPSRTLPGGATPGRPHPDEHAVEMAVARLRRGLGRGGLVETVVKRGYRLACDPVRPGPARLTGAPEAV